jgi:hypothetical protein
MKIDQLLLVSIICFLSSCSNREIELQQQKISTSTSLAGGEIISSNSEQKAKTINYDYSYSFSNNAICQILYIKVLNKSKKYDDIPEEIEFKLYLKDKIKNTYLNIIGKATLTSPNESFLDETNPDGGAYFAADFNKNNTEYTINITLDIESYEACAVSIKPDAENMLENYTKHLKKYPDYNVLKRGDCK